MNCHAVFGTQDKGCPLLGLRIASKHSNPGSRARLPAVAKPVEVGSGDGRKTHVLSRTSLRPVTRGACRHRSACLKKKTFLVNSVCSIQTGSHGDGPRLVVSETDSCGPCFLLKWGSSFLHLPALNIDFWTWQPRVSSPACKVCFVKQLTIFVHR